MAALVDSEMCSRVPVIVILGATGSGKSKLGIEIAKRFGGEILSADSMQAYKGLDIITNKVTAEERAEAPHHLLDVVTPPRPFSVVEFRDAAVPLVESLRKQDKLPVIVGGTNYYIESLLWRVLVASEPDTTATGSQSAPDASVASDTVARTEDSDALAEPKGPNGADDNLRTDVSSNTNGKVSADPSTGAGDEPATKRARLDASLEELSSSELHRRLQEVDPDMARRLHPNNRRRILRSLQVFSQLGRPHSEVLREQRLSEGGSALGGPLRYPHSAIFWLQCDQATLDARLDGRVDDMLERGLVAELLDFHARYNAQRIAENEEADYTRGIFQSIGFKEFHEYLLLAEEERGGARGQRLFQEAVVALKTVTRRYARKQLRWVTNRFLRQPQRQVPPVYAFDTSDPSKWEDLVYKPAIHIVESLLSGTKPTDIKPLSVEESLSNEPISFHCDVCDRIFIGNIQWDAHMNSKKHKKVVRQKSEANKNKGLIASPEIEKKEGGDDTVFSESESTVAKDSSEVNKVEVNSS